MGNTHKIKKSNNAPRPPDGRTDGGQLYNDNSSPSYIGGWEHKGKRGIQVYNMASLMAQTGRDQEGKLLTWGMEVPYFYLTISQRNDIFKLSTPVFGVVTSRMNRIADIDFQIVPLKHDEDHLSDRLKGWKMIYSEYNNPEDILHATVRAKCVSKIKETLPDILPDLSNFSGSILRWKKAISNRSLYVGDEIKEWMMEPNNGVTWNAYIKKVVYNLMIHGCEGTYKQVIDGKLENFDSLPGGSVFRMKAPYFSGVDGYIQMLIGYEPQFFFSNELMYFDYLPASTQNYGFIPLEALINKVSEGLLFDRLMAEQADGTKWPEKLVVVTNNQSPYGNFDNPTEIPMDSNEQKRIETKLNEPRKGAVITMSGNDAKLIDLTKENTMAFQNQRQKDIREEVALVFNASNVEMNLTGSQSTNGRESSEMQQEIAQGKGIGPILKLLEGGFTKNIIPFRYGFGFKFEFMHEKNEMETEEIDQKRLMNGKITVNELREEAGLPTFRGDQYDLPGAPSTPPPTGDQNSPLYTKQI